MRKVDWESNKGFLLRSLLFPKECSIVAMRNKASYSCTIFALTAKIVCPNRRLLYFFMDLRSNRQWAGVPRTFREIHGSSADRFLLRNEAYTSHILLLYTLPSYHSNQYREIGVTPKGAQEVRIVMFLYEREKQHNMRTSCDFMSILCQYSRAVDHRAKYMTANRWTDNSYPGLNTLLYSCNFAPTTVRLFLPPHLPG